MKKENKMDCRQAQRYFYDYLTEQKDPEFQIGFEHIDSCPQCQEQIRRLQSEIGGKSDSCSHQSDIFALHHRYLSEWIDCDIVKPFLAALGCSELCIEGQTPITVHIDRCRLCENNLQTILSMGLTNRQLAEAAQILSHETIVPCFLNHQEMTAIETIRDSMSSGIVTRLDVNSEGKTYIQVRNTPGIPLTRRHFLARFAAAAGIILVASLVIMMTTTAGGVSLQDVYHAIHTIENCKIEICSIDKNTSTVIQTILISRKFNLILSQRKDETSILDFQNKKITKFSPDTGITTEPSDSTIVLTINRPDFGLLPFESVTQIPPGYHWNRQAPMSQNDQYDIYELNWTESTTAVGTIERVWRGYLLKGSHLPIRIQWFEKRSGRPVELVTEAIIQYPNTEAIQRELEANSVYSLLRGDQIK